MTNRWCAEVAIVGAGPAASSLLERLVANVPELLGERPVTVHLIDPHRTGTGRVWRVDNHAALWMNSLAEDVTMFTDDSVVVEGPIWLGPSLFEWAMSVSDDELERVAPTELIQEIRALRGTSFPTRRVQSAYLEWFHRRVIAAMPSNVEVVGHRATAIDVVDDGPEASGPEATGRQIVHLDNGEAPLVVDVVVLALGHLDAVPDESATRSAAFATRHGLVHIGAGHTAELDLSSVPAGADVISLGFGQAFTDLLVLLTEGRGGRFVVEPATGDVTYEASGHEPVIHVGSRRGVPYHSKIDYRLQAPPAPLPRFLDEPAVAALLAADHLLDFRRDILPLVLKEVGWAYYHELFVAHPERTATSWNDFSARYESATSDAELQRLIHDAVPDRDDIFDIARLNAPLAGVRLDSAEAVHRHIRDYVRADIARRTDAAFSADLGAFNALLQTFGTIARIAASGRMTTRSRIDDVGVWWFSFFMYFASGPPPARLRQMLALERAGLVRFLGANTTVTGDHEHGRFIATSSSHPDRIEATALIDAVIAAASVSRSADPLVRRLHDRGEIVEELATDDGWSANTGKVVVAGPALHVLRADGRTHPARHAIGSFTNRPAAGAFSRPRTNAPTFRQNDVVARAILTELGDGSRAPGG